MLKNSIVLLKYIKQLENQQIRMYLLNIRLWWYLVYQKIDLIKNLKETMYNKGFA